MTNKEFAEKYAGRKVTCDGMNCFVVGYNESNLIVGFDYAEENAWRYGMLSTDSIILFDSEIKKYYYTNIESIIFNSYNSYNRRTWLNKATSLSTGSLVAIDGEFDGERYTMLQISDCYGIAKLHKSDYDTDQDFIDKLELLKDEVTLFIKHLKSKL